MKKIIQFIGKVLIGAAIIFFLAYSFIVVSDGKVFKDILGLTVPRPPTWTSFVPYLGFVVDYIFQFFSLHGLAGLAITFALLGTGLELNKYKSGVQ